MNKDDLVLTSTTDSQEAVQAALGITPEDAAKTATEAAAAEKVEAATATESAEKTTEAAAAAESTETTEAKTGETEKKDDAVAVAAADEAKKVEAKKAAGAAGGRAKSKLDTRIKELVEERNEARGETKAKDAEVAALSKRVAELLGAKAEAKEKSGTADEATPLAPKVEDFPDYDQYLVAHGQYVVDRAREASKKEVDAAVATALKQRDEETAKRTHAAAQAEAQERYEHSVEAAKLRHDDFDDVVNRPVRLTNVMFDGISDSEVGGEMAYYLATNDDVRAKLFAMGDSMRAVKELGKIEALVEKQLADEDAATGTAGEATVATDDAGEAEVDEAPKVAAKAAEKKEEAKPVKKVSTKAPDPISPSKGGTVSQVPMDQLSFSDYKAQRKKQLEAKGVRL